MLREGTVSPNGFDARFPASSVEGSLARPFYAQHGRRARGGRLGAKYRSRGTRSRRPAMEPRDRVKAELERVELVAGNGLLDRRTFLRSGAAFAAAVTGYTVARSAGAAPLKDDPWSLVPGAISPSYEQRSRFEGKIVRTLSNPNGETSTSHARTPHLLMNGSFTPNGLHLTNVHSRTPDIDPDRHRLVIH